MIVSYMPSKDSKSVHNIKNLLAAVLVFVICTHGATIILQFKHFQQVSDSNIAASAFFSLWLALTLFAAVILHKALMFSPRLFKPLSFFIFFISSLSNAASFQLSQQLSSAMVHAALLSPYQDVASFINLKQILIFMLGMMGWIAYLIILRTEIHKKDNPKAHIICWFFVLFIMVSDSSILLSNQPPYDIIKPILSDIVPWKNGPIKDETPFTATDTTPRTYVLVIGESARSDHMQLNGYTRATNPYLLKTPHIVSYKDVMSCATLTHLSLTCMLTDATLDDFKTSIAMIPKWGFSMLEGFKRAHFNTGWIGMQGYRSFIPMPYLQLADEAQFAVFPGGQSPTGLAAYDEKLLPYVDDFLAKHEGQPNLLIIHLYGSHFPYDIRYPKNFQHFQPTCESTSELGVMFADNMKDCDHHIPLALHNSYDNSLIYTDYMLSEIIHRLQQRNALMIYVSDHGESLGEKGRYLHGSHHAPEQRRVPLIFWASDSYIQDKPLQWDSIVRHAPMSVSHDYIFHSLLNCAGITSPRIDPQFSLCTENPRPRAQILQ